MRDFEKAIINNWGSRFHCPVSTIEQNGTTLLPDEKYADQSMIILWYIGKHTFALFDPVYTEILKDITARFPINTSLSGDNIQQALGAKPIVSRDFGLIHYLLPSDLPNLATPPLFKVRKLELSDQELLTALYSNCSTEEVNDSIVEIGHEIVFGCFLDDELVSAASDYRMTDFMDIGVLTHANFRKLGLGKMMVGALYNRAIAHNIIAQYRYNIHNKGPLGLAISLKFRHYFGSESIALTP